MVRPYLVVHWEDEGRCTAVETLTDELLSGVWLKSHAVFRYEGGRMQQLYADAELSKSWFELD